MPVPPTELKRKTSVSAVTKRSEWYQSLGSQINPWPEKSGRWPNLYIIQFESTRRLQWCLFRLIQIESYWRKMLMSEQHPRDVICNDTHSRTCKTRTFNHTNIKCMKSSLYMSAIRLHVIPVVKRAVTMFPIYLLMYSGEAMWLIWPKGPLLKNSRGKKMRVPEGVVLSEGYLSQKDILTWTALRNCILLDCAEVYSCQWHCIDQAPDLNINQQSEVPLESKVRRTNLALFIPNTCGAIREKLTGGGGNPQLERG